MKPEIQSEKFRKQLLARVQQLIENMIDHGDNTPSDETEEVGKLAKLFEIERRLLRAEEKKLWPVIILFLSTLFAMSILLFVRLPSTEIELDILASEFSFHFPIEQDLFRSLEVADLGITGLSRIHFPRYKTRSERVLSSRDDANLHLRLSALESDRQQGTISLSGLVLPSGSRVTLKRTPRPNEIVLALDSASIRQEVFVHGPVRVAISGKPTEEYNFRVPKAISVQTELGEMEMTFSLQNSKTVPFISQLLAEKISFLRVDELQGDRKMIVRHISTVREGSIFLQALNGQEYPLRHGEEIRFGASQGELRIVEVDNGFFLISYHGTVQDMKIGAHEYQWSLMPTLLEWLRERHSLSLLWGSSLYLFGLVFSFLRWRRSST